MSDEKKPAPASMMIRIPVALKPTVMELVRVYREQQQMIRKLRKGERV
ncbi:MAG: hypothetical protein KDK27_04635 [Leptospiraceae bacterium]|nr:hypothetical protein [Leptospiraceae bacterium]